MRLTLLGLFLLSGVALADQTCDELLQAEREFNSETPRSIDEFTELTLVKVNCETRVVSYQKRLLVPGDSLAPGAKERKQRQHTQLNCNKRGLASTADWTAMDVLSDVDFKYLFTLTTTPADCLGAGEAQ